MNPLRLAASCGAAALLILGVTPAFSATPTMAPLELARQLNQAFIELADKVSPSVVVISVAHRSPHANLEEDEDIPDLDQIPKEFRKWLDRKHDSQKKKEKEKEQEEDEDSSKEKEKEKEKDPVFDGQGSGVVIRKEGFILTNRHVIDGADKIKVRFRDGSEFDGEVRGADAQSDVAVIQIRPGDKELVAATLADSDKTRVGEFAVAIGAPFELDYSVTFGHISAKGRSDILRSSTADQDFLQTDANINPGNSGGPLVNIDGEVIGINTLIRGMRTGIGFALPSNLAREVSDAIIADGKFVRGYLGVELRALKNYPMYREFLTNVQEGVFVRAILADGPAARSALRTGDIITAIEGKPIASAQQLRNEIRGNKVGKVLTLDVHRLNDENASQSLKVKVKPEPWPDTTTPVVARKPQPAKEEKARTFGLTVETVTRELANQHGVDRVDGVIVTDVERGSLAHKNQLEPGDIIVEVNRKPVKNLKDFRDALKNADLKKGVLFNFKSKGTLKSEVFKESGE